MKLKYKNKMKKMVALFAFVAMLIGGVNAQTLSIDKEIHDYGEIEKGANGTCQFVVTNTGDKPLIISQCKGSCGCTVPECTKEPIAPGAKTSIIVKYDTQRVGMINKSVTIYSNDPERPQKSVRIKGQILQGDAPAPSSPVKTGSM